MSRLRRAAPARVLLALLLLPMPAATRAQSSQPATRAGAAPVPADTSRSTPARLAEARELIKTGDYDPAIETLRAAVARSGDRPDELRDAYLLLIKTYVFLGNDYKFKPQGREASNLNYRAARELIAECLNVPALRQTRPEPATDYPPEMIAFFSEARSRLFGAFRVIGVEPPNARVLLDGDTLRVPAGESAPAVGDLPVGSHAVQVRAPGFKDMNETITISPSATLERSYRLERRRGAGWYAGRAAGALGIVGGAVALLAGNKKGETSTTQPLPGAPPPPSP